MRLCFPIEKEEGLESKVFGHFGSAPAFLIVELEKKDTVTVINRDMHHAHGSCSPIKALDGQQVNAVITGGIGGGALAGLNAAGIEAYQAVNGTVKENIEAFEGRTLPRFVPGHTCGGHSGCAH